MKYDHRKIEARWQKVWEKQKLHKVPDAVKGKENFYTLVEFPYPSGNLHVGHWYAFSVPDIFVRMKRMRGQNTLFPIGFDAFGLPAENAALQRGINPKKWTLSNIAYMRKQILTMGASFDWSREVITADPEYYKWTQWIFLQFFKKGLAYQAETNVNWCPKDKTVLANEQVVDGKCDRCGSVVEQRKMKQWQLRITDYAEKLLQGLEKLDWPEEIKQAQRNWIGKSEGAEIEFGIQNADFRIKRFVLLHGKGGSPESNFLPWLKRDLEARGYEVEAPAMPNPSEPNDDKQAEFVLKNTKLDENTAVIGHSFGGIVALRLLEKGVKLSRVILAATPFTAKFLDGKPRSTVAEALRKGFDFEKIKKNSPGFSMLYDTSDDVVSPTDGDAYAKKLGGDVVKVQAESPHFRTEKEPAILNAIFPSVKVFTTRADTIFGATYLVVAPEHELIQNLESRILNIEEVENYIQKAKRKTELQRLEQGKEKTGVELKGIKAINPATKEEIPVWMADYVLASYGTGAIMAVPAHDERDLEFAEKFDLPIKQVIHNSSQPPLTLRGGATPSLRVREGRGELEAAYIGQGKLINSGKYNGLDSRDARKKITQDFGKLTTQYKIRDWVISRQRYWGVPIPVVHCEDCGVQPVPEKDLPVKLPEIKDYKPKGDGKSPLAKAEKWVKVKCPNCGKMALRESDTMDTFVDSSWYFLRYTDPKNKKKFADGEKLKKWMPVDMYSGGAEHTTMHLLYSRFWIKAMYDLGLVPWDEPYVKRMNRGIILGPDGRKMSKRWGNVVDPDKYVHELGADTVRMYLAFIGPYNVVGAYPWDPKGIMGARRFLEKTWRFFQNFQFTISNFQSNTEIIKLLNKTVKKVTEDIESFKFNTCVSALMILMNEFSTSSNSIKKGDLEIFLKLLAPFAPHIAEELWQELGHKTSIHIEPWPRYDKKLIIEDTVNIPVQINGRHRATIQIPKNSSQADAEASAKLAAQSHLLGKAVRKVIYVPGKIINFVL
ncbi:MAG: leucine--tRNA ligase [bacterium]|nr:leucine--tRNA ligase [bacterium]